jgi:hypothetical protein
MGFPDRQRVELLLAQNNGDILATVQALCSS